VLELRRLNSVQACREFGNVATRVQQTDQEEADRARLIKLKGA
jgi:hypothetical protein